MTERDRLKQIIIELSYEKRLVTLASGRQSDFYFDGKQTTLHSEGGWLVGKLFYEAIKDIPGLQAVGGITLGADPIATATSIAALHAGNPLHAFIIRKEPKGHGTGQWLEGRKNLPPGTKVIIVEDVVTTGGSSMKAVNRAKEEGLDVLGIVALVDREEGGRENIEAEGYWLKAIFTKSQLVSE